MLHIFKKILTTNMLRILKKYCQQTCYTYTYTPDKKQVIRKLHSVLTYQTEKNRS